EEYKKIYGISTNNFEGKIARAAQPVLAIIVSEIKKAIAYYSEKFPTDPVKQFLVTGGSSRLPGLTPYFTNAIGLETIIANPWKVLVDQEVPKDIIENAPEYSVAVGLAIR
ncbi:MAG TPA: pilus assembly protein PilM, partial [Patescibacteria group bacterium]|nr:pilus assembly protein PilM [Patescibacteria group bacterium]